MPERTDESQARDGMIETMLRALDAELRRAPAAGVRRDHVLDLARMLRGRSPEAAVRLDEFWVARVAALRSGLHEAAQKQEALKELLDSLTAPPWRVATFLGTASMDDRHTVMVMHEGARLIVSLAEGLEAESFAVGEEVLLNHERNLVAGPSPFETAPPGETATFDRIAPDGRVVIRSRDEEFVVTASDALRAPDLRPGDRVLWDRRAWMASEKVDRPSDSVYFLEETPDDTFGDVGGLDDQIDRLQRSIRLHLEHPEVVELYRSPRLSSLLLVGPPGTGKTLVARALANWIARLSRSGRSRFMNIKPGSLHSMWYAQSEANYREAFRVAREAGDADPDVPVVMFFDEVDAIGSARGVSHHRVDDRVLTAFMTELDGLEARGNILVVAATNRRDALDPALLRPGRLGDLVLEIPRPDRDAAVEIFGKHLHPEIPYRAAGDGAVGDTAGDPAGERAAEARREMIQSAASRIYAPNADGELATLTLRDGTRRTVTARDLVSGAVIEKIARAAVERACARDAEGGGRGLTGADLLAAIESEFETAARALTPANCRRFVSDLPQDVDVVRVEPVVSRGRRVHRYLSVA